MERSYRWLEGSRCRRFRFLFFVLRPGKGWLDSNDLPGSRLQLRPEGLLNGVRYPFECLFPWFLGFWDGPDHHAFAGVCFCINRIWRAIWVFHLLAVILFLCSRRVFRAFRRFVRLICWGWPWVAWFEFVSIYWCRWFKLRKKEYKSLVINKIIRQDSN